MGKYTYKHLGHKLFSSPGVIDESKIIEIKLDPNYYSGKTFKIIANNNSEENIYIQSMLLNGEPLERYWITHEEITQGGILELEMGLNSKKK